jgi:hypothetical protein
MSAEIRWRLTKPVSRPAPASGPRADPDRNPARVSSILASAAGAIQRRRGGDRRQAAPRTWRSFGVAAAQLVWGVVSS